MLPFQHVAHSIIRARDGELRDRTLDPKCLILKMVCTTYVCISLSRAGEPVPATCSWAAECGQPLECLVSAARSVSDHGEEGCLSNLGKYKSC